MNKQEQEVYEQIVRDTLIAIGLDPIKDKEEINKMVEKYWPGVMARKAVEDLVLHGFNKAGT